MYFTYGWPKILRVPEADPPSRVSKVLANRDRIIFAVITHSTLSIWTSKPCLPVVSHQRSQKSVEKLGHNVNLVWKPDSTALVVVTAGGYLLFYGLGTGSKNLYEQIDPENNKLRRESDELFLKEPIPAITIQLISEVAVRGRVIGSITIFREELMVSTDENNILRYRWDGTINNDFCIDLRRIPFSVDQQASRAVPLQDPDLYPVDFHFSPTIGGFSLVLSDGRAAFLTATTKVYDPNSVQGIWAGSLDDVTCSCVSHKYRLLSFGRKNAETAVFSVDDQTGGLTHLFNLNLSSRDFPGSPGAVRALAWTPDGCAIAVSWEKGGFALWSVFGSLLTCSWSWTGDLSPYSQKIITSFDWAAEGYQLWMAVEPNLVLPASNAAAAAGHSPNTSTSSTTSRSSLAECVSGSSGVFGVLSFVKSALTVNPGMSQIEHLYLQGEDRLLINVSSDSITSTNSKNANFPNPNSSKSSSSSRAAKVEILPPLGNNKNWVVIPIPDTYLATNWPIRYTAMDPDGLNLAISGRYGLAHYSVVERKWKLFGNEAQEHDFVVVGGMMWWDSFLVVAVYDIAQDRDELRFYPRDSKLDNKFALIKRLPSQILLMSLDRDKLLTFAADSTLAIFQLKDDLKSDSVNPASIDPCDCLQTIDVGALCVHPACVISVYLTTLRTSFSSTSAQEHSVVINVSGRLMILHHEYLVQDNNHGSAPQYITPTVLASCVEMVWLPRAGNPSLTNSGGSPGMNHNIYLSEALWLYCGQEMRVWLPLREKSQSSVHTFISNRIMLGFPVSIYPLTILFDKAIILGAENDSLSYTTGVPSSPDPYGAPNALFPFCILQRTSQVYLHQILRQLIRRNLGYYAWEIARSCSKLPYFPHSLELLLHEVLEEEATSKEPIPDALLPSVIEFVREFPVYLRTVGQCARKTELALWPHLFSVAGRPRALFDECLQRGQLDIAATYLLVIQNLESPTISRKFATQLVDKALEHRKLDLVKDLVRFLKAIDPNDVEPVRTSLPKFNTQTPPISPSEYDISMVLGTMQVPRMRSLSTSVVPKFPELPHRDLHRTNSDNRGGGGGGGSSSTSPSPNQPLGSGGGQNVSNHQNNSNNNSISSPGQPSPTLGANNNNNAAAGGNQQHSTVTSIYGDGQVSAAMMGMSSGNVQNNSSYYTEFPSTGQMMDKASLGTAYVDAIVERHSRKILAEGKLRDLGKLAAHLDFHLVSWLRREKRRRPVMVTDFVAALKMIHSEFEWPYPEFVGAPSSQHSRTPSTDSMKFATPEATSPLKPISVDILGNRLLTTKLGIGNGNDSGYNSTPGNHGELRDGHNPVEARLVPNPSANMDDTLSVLSEESMALDQAMLPASDLLPVFSMTESSKLSLLNSSKSGIELRFMQQIMWEAGVLDWSLIISIALRDALGVVRTVNSSRDQSPEILRNLRDGLLGLALWANTQCLGYKVFMTAINSQVSGLLAKYLAGANNHQSNSSSSASSSHGELNRRKTEPLIGGRARLASASSNNNNDSSGSSNSNNLNNSNNSNNPSGNNNSNNTSRSGANNLASIGKTTSLNSPRSSFSSVLEGDVSTSSSEKASEQGAGGGGGGGSNNRNMMSHSKTDGNLHSSQTANKKNNKDSEPGSSSKETNNKVNGNSVHGSRSYPDFNRHQRYGNEEEEDKDNETQSGCQVM